MKKTIFGILVIVSFFSCAKKNESKEEMLVILEKWASTIQNNDYEKYSNLEEFPDDMASYKEKYGDYYPKNFHIFKIENMGEILSKDLENHVKIRVTFQCEFYPRKSGIPKKIMKGTVDIVKYKEGARKNNGWLISEMTTFTYDD